MADVPEREPRVRVLEEIAAAQPGYSPRPAALSRTRRSSVSRLPATACAW